MCNNGLAISRLGELACQPRERGRAAFSGVIHVQCHCCGYEPPMGRAPRRCPKCGSGAWERYIVPGSLLVAALHRRPEELTFGKVCSTCQPPVWTRFMHLTETLRDRGRMLLEDEDVSSNPDRGG